MKVLIYVCLLCVYSIGCQSPGRHNQQQVSNRLLSKPGKPKVDSKGRRYLELENPMVRVHGLFTQNDFNVVKSAPRTSNGTIQLTPETEGAMLRILKYYSLKGKTRTELVSLLGSPFQKPDAFEDHLRRKHYDSYIVYELEYDAVHNYAVVFYFLSGKVSSYGIEFLVS
jgi:hypothetical protein